jgi:hypothetical protein
MELNLTYELDQFEPLYAADDTSAKGVPKVGNNQPGAEWLPVENVDVDALPIHDTVKTVIWTGQHPTEPNRLQPHCIVGRAGGEGRLLGYPSG